jgi:hypothetical protein
VITFAPVTTVVGVGLAAQGRSTRPKEADGLLVPSLRSSGIDVRSVLRLVSRKPDSAVMQEANLHAATGSAATARSTTMFRGGIGGGAIGVPMYCWSRMIVLAMACAIPHRAIEPRGRMSS